MVIELKGNASVMVDVTLLNDSLKQTPCLGQVYSLDLELGLRRQNNPPGSTSS